MSPTRHPRSAHDLAVITVSANSARWLRPCLSTLFAHAGDLALDVVVADAGSTDDTAELVGREFPAARVVSCENRGFAHGNNAALATTDARYVLFLNPDTETRHGSYAELVAVLDDRPEVGLVGVRQIDAAGRLQPTIRRFPSIGRALGEALAAERWAPRNRWLGERERDPAVYERDVPCDWTSGSFMLARREALESAGWMDERFFLFSEEPDLCLRIRQAGWEVRHLPTMTIVHHGGGRHADPRFEAQEALSRRLYARKHFAPASRGCYLAAVGLGLVARSVLPAPTGTGSRAALRALFGRGEPPFGPPPAQAIPVA